MMDSWKIAHELEKRYPSPSLHLDNPITIQVRDHIKKFMGPLESVLLPKVPAILQERCAEYFNRTREEWWYKMPLSEYAKTKDVDECFSEAEGPAKEIAELLKKNGGPFFLGETGESCYQSMGEGLWANRVIVSYADFIFVAFLQFVKRLDESAFERFVGFDDAIRKVFDASKEWLEKDD
jgi:glutathione S-transferase